METSNVRNILSTPSYSSLFEYASEIVRNFIESEKIIHSNDLEGLFGDNAWFSNFFNCNLYQLKEEAVRDALKTALSHNNGYNPELARTEMLYSTLCMAVGENIVRTMLDNLFFSINGLGVIDKDDHRREFLRKHPILIVSALGNLYFCKERKLFIQSQRWQKSTATGTTH